MSRCEEGFTFKTPSSILVVGPSNSGKTTFVKRLILENIDLFETWPTRVVYCYGSWQPMFKELKAKGVTFHEGVPEKKDFDKWFAKVGGGMLIMDDLMADGGDDKTVMNIFTQHSHHMNLTVLYLTQDLFPKGKYATTISRNVQYIIVFKNPRDKLALRSLLLQMYPVRWKQVLDKYNEVTERPFGYLVFDVHPATVDNRRMVSHLLRHEGFIRCHPYPFLICLFKI